MGKTGPDRKVTDERLLLEILINPDPAVFASEIVPHVPYTRQQVSNRLSELEDVDLVYSKRASGRRLWWLTRDGRQGIEKAARRAVDEVD